jgi:hypothetical protein
VFLEGTQGALLAVPQGVFQLSCHPGQVFEHVGARGAERRLTTTQLLNLPEYPRVSESRTAEHDSVTTGAPLKPQCIGCVPGVPIPNDGDLELLLQAGYEGPVCDTGVHIVTGARVQSDEVRT